MKKIKILKTLVEVVILGLIGMGFFLAVKLNPYLDKFGAFSDQMPQRSDFDGLRVVMRVLPILASFKIIIPIVFFVVLLFLVRKVLVSILAESFFSLKQVKLIRKIAVIYLVFTGVLFSFNLLLAVFALGFGKGGNAVNVLLTALGSSIGYLITSLIAYIIAEIFLVGAKLKEDAELTI